VSKLGPLLPEFKQQHKLLQKEKTFKPPRVPVNDREQVAPSEEAGSRAAAPPDPHRYVRTAAPASPPVFTKKSLLDISSLIKQSFAWPENV
jgi:hypothetical protein